MELCRFFFENKTTHLIRDLHCQANFAAPPMRQKFPQKKFRRAKKFILSTLLHL